MEIIKNGTNIVFKIKLPNEQILVVQGKIIDYNEFTGIFTIEDKDNKKHLRGINKIWFDIVIAQKTENSGNFKLIK